MSHTRTGWYEECFEHPQSGPDAPDAVWDAWKDRHFTIGGEDHGDGQTFWTCEARRLFDICAECTFARQQAEESDEVCVRWPCPASTSDGAQ